MASDTEGALKVRKSDAARREQPTPEQYRITRRDGFDSRTGWPSFHQPSDPGAVTRHRDRSFLMVRTEIRYADCDAPLAHIFKDVSPPTGLHATSFEPGRCPD